ncbi:MAG: flagellar biosynthetic protein FliQ [Deltaproteobacteria bacterium]|nr:flagellar biosynthetic protein FliQ [Deltaproteobacteria bacterium]
MAVEDFIVQVTNEAIMLTVIISMPTIAISLLLGLIVALFQATTQIQEQTLSFVPKMVGVFAVLAATGPWVGATMVRFGQMCLGGFVDVIR